MSPAEVKAQSVPTVVDADRPWPGLFPFTEEQHQYFFGRDGEIDELFRCVKRDTVTLLYSKSGLGKSSLLQAGLFPRLRKAAFLPVYIRLKYDDAAGSLEWQVQSSLQDAIKTGDFAEVASPAPEESLWEYLHRRGGNLIDHSGSVVCPVLVFDQFEEVFTLGASNETTRQLRDQFLACFADLVENSIPKELRDQLADNPKLATQLDFSATGCRFVVALREEYVTKLEGLRNIPSLAFARSRMPLKEMSGEQALLAVSKPNPGLLADDVPRLIVSFVAGDREGRPLSELEVAPAILSLFCRELSIKRGNLPQITSDLVTGNADTIIDDFYHRCMVNKPAAVQRLIEDELVTESGYRNNIDLNDAKMELEQVGVPGSVIDSLVDDRVLHIEDYRGKLRLELTHDVLLEPVKRSREQRREKEAQERKQAEERAALAEAKRAQEREKEAWEKKQAEERAALAEAKRAHELTRARFLQKVAAGLFLVAIMLLGMFLYAMRQKKSAETAESRALANEKDARRNQQTAERLRIEAQANADSAEKARGEALANAAAATRAKAEAEKAKQVAQSAKEEADRKSKQLAKVSTAFLDTCDSLAKVFREEALEMLASPEEKVIADDLFKVYESIAESCVSKATELHKADPDNLAVTAWLGEERLKMASSANMRNAPEKAREHCNQAIAIADSFRNEPKYKTKIVAARTYTRVGSFLVVKLHDPAAVATAENGVRLVIEIQSQQEANRFNAWDWDKLSDVYYARGNVSQTSDRYDEAIRFYEQSFEAEQKAYRQDADEGFAKFAMDRAGDIADDERKLQRNALAAQWDQKLSTIAYEHVDQEDIYSDALVTLYRNKEFSNARKLIDLRIELLARDQKSPKAKAQLADAYVDSSALSLRMNDWPRAVDDAKKAVDILLKEKATTTAVDTQEKATTTAADAQKKLASALAQAYGNLAWSEILAGQFAAALEDARRGLREDPAQSWIGVNEAHALLFTGQVAEAKSKYMALEDLPHGDHKLVDEIKGDFQRLCERNFKNPEMANIAKELGIEDPKLASCLASPPESK